MQKIELEFNESSYNAALAKDAAKADAKKELYKQLSLLLNRNVTKTDEITAQPVKYFYEQLEIEKKDVNLMNLKAEKLCALLDIDISDLQKAKQVYDRIIITVKPTKEQFTIYAETPQEIEKYNLAQEILAIMAKVEAIESHTSWRDVFYPVVVFSTDKRPHGYEPNVRYIKDKNRK